MGIRPFSWGHFGIVPDPPEPPEDQEPTLEVGDWIKCRDKEDMVATMYELLKEGYDTDFRYERHGLRGLWLEITAIEREVNDGD